MGVREIIFRGKRISDGSWVYGGIMHTFHPNYDNENEEAFLMQKSNCYCICANNKDYFVEQSSIGQYTGLTDKNGTKIFEGDILKLRYSRYSYKVYFEDYRYYIEDCWGTSITPKQEAINHFECEVIGNIYDNPELLEGDDVKD